MEKQIRKLIRETIEETFNEHMTPEIIEEEISNFLKPQKEAKTRQLKNTSSSENLGDPIKDVEMNQMADDQGSDGQNAPTVSVRAGATKGGSDFNTGQKQASFSEKTKQAK